MAHEEIYFIKLVAWLTQALGQGSVFVSDLDTDSFGTRLPEAIIKHPDVQAAMHSVGAAGQSLLQTAGDLENAADSGDETQLVAALFKVADGLHRFYVALDNLISGISAQINPANIPDAGERALALAFAASLARKIFDYLILDAIESRPRLALLLKLIGLIEWTRVPADPANPLSQPHIKKSIKLNAIKDLISNPGQHFINTLGWGSPGFDPTDFFLIIESFYTEEDDVRVGFSAGDPFIEHGIFRLRRDSSQSPPGLTLEINATLERQLTTRINLSDLWGIGIDTNLHFAGGASATLRPPLDVSLAANTGEASGEFRLYANRNPEARPFDILGGNSLLSLSAQDVSIGVGLAASLNAISGTVSIDPLVFSDLKGLTLRLGSQDSDSFIGSLLASAQIEGDFDLGLEWRASSGLRVKASGGIEIALPIHKQLGPIEFETIYLVFKILADGTLSLELSTALTGSLGPLRAAVDRMGILLDLRFVEGTDARFGPLDLGLRFKPPNGVGLSISAGPVSGGGYLFFDYDKEEYGGVLQLDLAKIVTVTAIGLITTRMPDGSQGFSLLIIITAEFGTGIQLGFGFTLLGVGGLLGLNRTMNLQALAEGVRNGALSNIMFPHDVIANAPRIISDLRNFFPPENGKFLIGPMVKLGWGTPTLVSLSLGIIIEIPGNIAIVGILRLALPTNEAALIVLQVSFIGALEFDKQRVWFFATLFESRVLFFTIEGDMGLLMAFGDDANFVLSVGGFHPQFNPPPLPFPSPRRISFSILSTPVQRIRVEGYFAVTSNTVQFGANAEIVLGFDSFGLEGHIGFDVLIQFSPFYFIAQISASVSLKAFGVGLFSIRLSFALSGPSGWRARGSGSISLLFFDISADFDISWGESKDTSLPPIAVIPLLTGELNKPENWRAELPAANNLLVSLRKLDPTTDVLVLHPVGTLLVSQKALPLDLNIDKIGNQKPNDAKRFSIEVPAGGLGKAADATEQFAIAQYQNMDDASKLSRPAYQPLNGGVQLSVAGQQLNSSHAVRRIVRYEQIIIDNNFKRFRKRFSIFASALFMHFMGGAAISKSALSVSYKTQYQPFKEKVTVAQEGYTVAYQADNKAYTSTATFSSEAAARDFMQQAIVEDPNRAETLHVIPQFEVTP